MALAALLFPAMAQTARADSYMMALVRLVPPVTDPPIKLKSKGFL